MIRRYGNCSDTEVLFGDLISCYQKPKELPRNFAQGIKDLLTKIRSSVALNSELNNASRNALNASHEKIDLKKLFSWSTGTSR